LNFSISSNRDFENTSQRNLNFFDDYPEFFVQGRTRAFPNRLNHRFQALIETNKDLINGKKILDVGSHDGRWSFAAIKNGATYVLGIELFPKLVKVANKIMERYNIPKEKYQFVVADVRDEIKKVTGKFDTVFCFGFFYHHMYHMDLLEEIKRLDPKHIIFDTGISLSNLPVIRLKTEKIGHSRLKAKIYPHTNEEIIVGWPSKSALELMLKQIGYDHKYYDWHNKGINNWKHLKDYQTSKHVTLVAERIS